MKKLIGPLFVMSITILVACHSENAEELFANQLPPPVSDTTTVKFQKDIEPLFRQSCSVPGCHVPGGTGVGLFRDYNDIKRIVDNGKLKTRVIDQMTMPPGGPLPPNQIALLRNWINQGASNN